MQGGILAAKWPVLLYLTRLDRFIQGISVSYRNLKGFLSFLRAAPACGEPHNVVLPMKSIPNP